MTCTATKETTQTLVGMDRQALTELARRLGQPPYRAGQLAGWVYRRGAVSYDEMTDLPAAFREALAGTPIRPLSIAQRQDSTDGVTKLLLNTEIGRAIEAVLLDCDERVSSCVSSQVGCPMRCAFCATGLGGYTTNLSAAEIVDQVLQLQIATGKSIDHIGVMGMGEPMLNLDEVVKALRILHDEVGVGYRRMSVSTVGIVPMMRKFAEMEIPVHLAVSLHTPTDSVRESIMPVNRKWPVREVVDASRYFVERTGRKVTFEYLMLDGINDTREQARRLAVLVKGIPCLVNLIPFNFVDTGRGFRRPSAERGRRFREELERLGVNVTQRKERGHDIDAACGQLKGRHDGKPIPLGLAFQNPPADGQG